MSRLRSVYPLLAVVLSGCGLGSSNPVKLAMAEHRTASSVRETVAFRFAGERGGDARIYVLPGLNEATWRFRTPGLAVQRVIGFSRDEDEIYLLNVKDQLVGLDLVTGRARTIDSSVVAAALGPTGTLHLVRADGSLGEIQYRNVKPWPDTLRQRPDALWAGASGQLLALLTGPSQRELVTLWAGKATLRQRIPNGPLAVSTWGDIAVVAVDSGLVVLDPADTSRRSFRPVKEHTDAIAFSPSAHRVYVASADQHLAALDRSSLDVVEEMQLPGRAAALRTDPLGRILLVRPVKGDSIWLVDAARGEMIGTLPGAWRDDLPAVAPDGSILTVRGQDIVVHAADSLTVHGRAANGARDRWLAAAWDPRRPALQLASDTAAVHPGEPGQMIYVQVSSTSNEAWAQDLARSLRAAGMQANVLPPTAEEERYRVVLGPYPTREAAEASGRKLGRPFWIFTREGQEPLR